MHHLVAMKSGKQTPLFLPTRKKHESSLPSQEGQSKLPPPLSPPSLNHGVLMTKKKVFFRSPLSQPFGTQGQFFFPPSPPSSPLWTADIAPARSLIKLLDVLTSRWRNRRTRKRKGRKRRRRKEDGVGKKGEEKEEQFPFSLLSRYLRVEHNQNDLAFYQTGW